MAEQRTPPGGRKGNQGVTTPSGGEHQTEVAGIITRDGIVSKMGCRVIDQVFP